MEGKLKELAERAAQLDSIDYEAFRTAPRPSPFSGDKFQPLKVHRSDRAALIERLQTYRPTTWFAKPVPLSPLACSIRGWCNTGHDCLTCEFCGSKILCKLPANPHSEATLAAAAQYVDLLIDAHHASCPWRTKPCDSELLSFPRSSSATMVSNYQHRLSNLQRLTLLPRIHPSLLTSLARQAADLSQPSLDALASTFSIRKTCLLNPTSSSRDPKPNLLTCSQLPAAQAAVLLAMTGWDAKLLLPNPNPSSTQSPLHQPPSLLPHLVQSSRPSSASSSRHHHHQQQQQAEASSSSSSSSSSTPISSTHAVLCCSLCNSSTGLWSYCQSGPFYFKSLQMEATTASVLSSPAAAASLPAASTTPQKVPTIDVAAAAAATQSLSSPSMPLGSPDPTPPSAALHTLNRPSQAVAVQLHRTIAGGALIGPSRASPAAPPPSAYFRSPSLEPPPAPAGPFGQGPSAAAAVFGLSAFQEEERKRRRSAGSITPAGPGAQPQGAGGAAGGGAEALWEGGGGGGPLAKLQRLEGQAAVAAEGAAEAGGRDAAAAGVAVDGAAGGQAGAAAGQESPSPAAPVAAEGGAGDITAAPAAAARKGAAAAAGPSATVAAGGTSSPPPLPAAAAAAGDQGGGFSHGGDFMSDVLDAALHLLNQPSLLSPAGGRVGAAEQVPFFDPLAQHRPWCPWVREGAGRDLKETIGKGPASTLKTTAGAAGGGLSGSGSVSSSGMAGGIRGTAAAAAAGGGGGGSGGELPGWMVLVGALQGEEAVKRAVARAAGLQVGEVPTSADVQRRAKELLGMLRDT